MNLSIALYGLSLFTAVASFFLPWFRLKYGVIGLAVSIGFWLGYESTVPTQANIRVDLLILYPVLIVAAISLAFAAANARKSKNGVRDD